MKIALYFGMLGRLGHTMHGLPSPNRHIGRMSYNTEKDLPGFPWSTGLLDSGLLVNGKITDDPDGRVWWTCGGIPVLWHAFYWWDRSGDERSNSNSGFYVRGFTYEEREPAFAFACETWPQVVARQHHPLVLLPWPRQG